jgi:hypothetical protein
MASASCTSNNNRSYRDFMTRSSGPRFERVPKVPGSKKLVHGRWVEVLPEDEDALASASSLQGCREGIA